MIDVVLGGSQGEELLPQATVHTVSLDLKLNIKNLKPKRRGGENVQ